MAKLLEKAADKTQALDQALRPAPTALPDVNERVRLHGLQRAELNGEIGTVIGPPAENGRVPVHLDPPLDKKLSLKPENLQLLAQQVDSDDDDEHASCFGLTTRCGTCGAQPAGERKFQRCARCNAVSYCSRECQQRGWQVLGHKRTCGKPLPTVLIITTATRPEDVVSILREFGCARGLLAALCFDQIRILLAPGSTNWIKDPSRLASLVDHFSSIGGTSAVLDATRTHETNRNVVGIAWGLLVLISNNVICSPACLLPLRGGNAATLVVQSMLLHHASDLAVQYHGATVLSTLAIVSVGKSPEWQGAELTQREFRQELCDALVPKAIVLSIQKLTPRANEYPMLHRIKYGLVMFVVGPWQGKTPDGSWHVPPSDPVLQACVKAAGRNGTEWFEALVHEAQTSQAMKEALRP